MSPSPAPVCPPDAATPWPDALFFIVLTLCVTVVLYAWIRYRVPPRPPQ